MPIQRESDAGGRQAGSPEVTRLRPASVAPSVCLEQLLRATDLLVRLSDVTLEESAGHLNGRGYGQRTQIARKQLEINLLVLRDSGGPKLEAAWKLIDDPPEFAFDSVAQVRVALDEIAARLEPSGVPGQP